MKSKIGSARCRSALGWMRAIIMRPRHICLKAVVFKLSSATADTRTQENTLANGVSVMTPILTYISVRSISHSTGKQQQGRGTVNISAIQRQARSVLKEMTALANQQQEGWWSGMPGRTHRTKQHTLRKRRSANNSTNSAKRPLSDPSRRPNKTVAYALYVCLVYQTCASSASSTLPFRTSSALPRPSCFLPLSYFKGRASVLEIRSLLMG